MRGAVGGRTSALNAATRAMGLLPARRVRSAVRLEARGVEPAFAGIQKQPVHSQGLLEAERGGFEPPLQETCKLVFETSAFNHSATSPSILVRSAAVAGRERIMD